MAALEAIRKAIRNANLADDAKVLAALRKSAAIPQDTRDKARARAIALVNDIRAGKTQGLMEVFLAEYGLSTQEGVALMCLAEALLRVPDAETIDALIDDKITPSHWNEHLGKSSSSLVNASTWALMLTGKVLDEKGDGDQQTARGHCAVPMPGFRHLHGGAFAHFHGGTLCHLHGGTFGHFHGGTFCHFHGGALAHIHATHIHSGHVRHVGERHLKLSLILGGHLGNTVPDLRVFDQIIGTWHDARGLEFHQLADNGRQLPLGRDSVCGQIDDTAAANQSYQDEKSNHGCCPFILPLSALQFRLRIQLATDHLALAFRAAR